MIICLAAANRDGVRYTRPRAARRRPGRARHLAFGHGIHHCLGAPLARMEGQIALGSLLRRFPELALAVPSEDLQWAHGDGLVLSGLSELPVIPGPALPRTPLARRSDPDPAVTEPATATEPRRALASAVDEGWGRRAVEFATLAEPTNCPRIPCPSPAPWRRSGDRLLDVACGAGLAVELAGCAEPVVPGSTRRRASLQSPGTAARRPTCESGT